MGNPVKDSVDEGSGGLHSVLLRDLDGLIQRDARGGIGVEEQLGGREAASKAPRRTSLPSTVCTPRAATSCAVRPATISGAAIPKSFILSAKAARF